MTNPLITEARRLRAAALAESPTFLLDCSPALKAFITLAVNNLPAFADKIEELEREIAGLRLQLSESDSEIHELRVAHEARCDERDAELERRSALQAQVEELHSSRDHLFGTVKELRVRDANALTVIEQLRSEVKTLRNQDVMLSEQNTKLREALAEIAGACLSFVESTGVPISDEAREQLRAALESK